MKKVSKQKAKSQIDFQRVEIHRHALAILPVKEDKDPGVAILVKENDGMVDQRFCTCAASKKVTCQHVLELTKAYQALNKRYGEDGFEEKFKASIWHQIAAEMVQGSDITPQTVRMQVEKDGRVNRVMAYNTLNREPLIIYRSQGSERLRFWERCGHSLSKDKYFHRGSVLKKLGALTLTENERYMDRQGFKTRRQTFEESFWHKVAYHCFREFDENKCVFDPIIEKKTGLCFLSCKDSTQKPLFQIPLSRKIVKPLFLGLKERNDAFSINVHPEPAKSLFDVSLTPDLDLMFQPLIQMTKEDGEVLCFERDTLDAFNYSQLFYIKEQNLFVKLENPDPLEQKNRVPKLMVIQKSRVPAFLDTFGDELRDGPYLIDKQVENLKIFKTFDWGKILLDAMDRDWCWLSMDYGFGKTAISLDEIYQARKTGQQYIRTPEGWVDCQSAGLDGFDIIPQLDIGDDQFKKTKKIKLSRMELLRLRAANEKSPEISGDKLLVDQLTKLFELKPSTPLPKIKGMSSKLRKYQILGTQWIWFLYENNFGGLLCDDMGLGKTHQVMAFMLHLKHAKKIKDPFLVVCPTTVLDHWCTLIKKYAPGLSATIYHGGERDLEASIKKSDVILTSYGVLRRDIKVICPILFSLSVFDEIQYIKNSRTLAYGAAKKINADMKIGLTGTPIENTITELKALMDLTVPGYLGTDGKFSMRYVKAMEKGLEKKRRQELQRLVYPFTLRRLKKTVLKELPEKIEDIRICHLSEDQIKLYQDAISKRGIELISVLKKKENPVPHIHIFALLTLLKQICDHPALLEEKVDNYDKYQSGKWSLFKEIITQSLESGQKVVVYSQFLGMVKIIEKFLSAEKVNFVSLTGASRNRGKIVSRFNNDPDCRVFVGSLKAGGTGIDLVAASVVIHYDRWWNAAKEDQATDRVHRIGQKRGVQVFKLVTQGTLEEKISAIIEKKRKLMASIVKEDDPGLLKTFSRKDLIDMLSIQG